MVEMSFITAGPIEWASSRMRCWWPAKYMERAEVKTFEDFMKTGVDPETHTVVWQKVAHPISMNEQQKAGVKVIWDLCDPLHWFGPADCNNILNYVDLITASSDALADDITAWCGRPVTTIKDRIDFDHFPIQRQHSESKPAKLIWYGLAANRMSLYSALANLDRLSANGYDFTLTIMDDRPDLQFARQSSYPIYHVKWELEKENRIIADHDIALLPPYPGPWGKVKSNNKKVTAWACGLPATDAMDYDDLLDLVTSWEYRRHCIVENDTLRSQYDSRKSAEQWEALC